MGFLKMLLGMEDIEVDGKMHVGTFQKEFKKAFGTEIFNHQAIAFKLADMAVKVENARNLCLKAAWLRIIINHWMLHQLWQNNMLLILQWRLLLRQCKSMVDMVMLKNIMLKG